MFADLKRASLTRHGFTPEELSDSFLRLVIRFQVFVRFHGEGSLLQGIQPALSIPLVAHCPFTYAFVS